MDKYLVLADLLNVDRARLDSVLELIIRGDEILSSVNDLVNGIVDRGFLNPGEAGYYYGLGGTASKLHSSIANLLKGRSYNSADFSRLLQSYTTPLQDDQYYQTIGYLKGSAGESTQISVRTGVLGDTNAPFQNLYLRSGEVKEDGSFSKAPCTILNSVDVSRFKDLGWVSEDILNSIYQRAGVTSGSTAVYTYLLTNVDIPSFLASIINLSVIGKGGIESQTQYIPAGYPDKFQTATVARYLSDPVSIMHGAVIVEKSQLSIVGYSPARHNTILSYGFADISRSGTATFNLSNEYPLDISDVWVTAYTLRSVLAHSEEMYCAVRLAKFLRVMDADFAQAGFTQSTDQSQINNWCFNYINLNLAGSPLRDQILNGSTYLPIADGLAGL